MSLNCNAVQALGIIAQKYDIPLIHISTDFVFDGHAKRPYLPNDLANPINYYGHSKYEGEKSTFKVVIMRLFFEHLGFFLSLALILLQQCFILVALRHPYMSYPIKLVAQPMRGIWRMIFYILFLRDITLKI